MLHLSLPQDTMSLSKAANANTLEQSRRIAEGFRALTQDYSELAARHWNVETQLESIVNQVCKECKLILPLQYHTHERSLDERFRPFGT